MQQLKIKSIKKLNIKNDRYDLTMNKNHNFFANGICIHNTSARTGLIKVVTELPLWKYRINKLWPIFHEQAEWQYVSGTRRVVLDSFTDPEKAGFYGSHEFRKKYHDKFVGNLRKGETVYYEIVGWVGSGTSIMGIVDNSKTKDKEFIKRYGQKTVFSYNCPEGENDIYVYRITFVNEDGYSIDLPFSAMEERCKELGVKPVQHLCKPFLFDGNLDALKKTMEDLYDGPSTIDPTHIREGAVIRIENGLNILVFKLKNFYFKVLEGIVKEADVVDIEEAEDIKEGEQNG
jgi:hypothetical protein